VVFRRPARARRKVAECVRVFTCLRGGLSSRLAQGLLDVGFPGELPELIQGAVRVGDVVVRQIRFVQQLGWYALTEYVSEILGAAENQLLQLREFAAQQGWTVVREYCDYETGSKADRVQFQQMFAKQEQIKRSQRTKAGLARVRSEGRRLP